ncbi:hypothetical protein PACTADRAFT_50374 [Pachysolen tannophilus NRRL Y-2460]|uniref:CHCH domain-containing protein n=1 Tax=Pachysolen tannophilus NRRL Y-2460 TaxID=669874 RepID=A0A1E4TVD1_PACTA|nr:hypothetical protein PACTADRAFT_50374 [Pachysolen tannophilus NRRL Y-2460]
MAPLQQVSRHGGPSKCFPEFQRVVECMTNDKNDSYKPCELFKNDYIECRKHKLERYKMFLMKNELQQQEIDEAKVGNPYVRKRQYLTPKTLGLVDDEYDTDREINLNFY